MRIYQRYVARNVFATTSELAREAVKTYVTKYGCTNKYAEHQIGKRVRVTYDKFSGIKPVKDILTDIIDEIKKGSM